ncbi:MAG: flagellar hook protein FlgE [Chloroflexi bacterium]|nr:flagellar hook protein FlgE [Chloroflexota bacterium]
MLRSMFTAIGALTLHQSFMDVVADNLANVNTPGYKASRASFQDQIAQLIQTGAAPGTNLGGVNPTQIGLGVRLGSVTSTFTQGSLQSTGRSTDLAIQGDGFFVYTNSGSAGATQFYSRDGSLGLDANGVLVNNSTGMRAMGWTAVTSGSTGGSAAVDTSQPIAAIQIPVDSAVARATANATLVGNLDSAAASGSVGQATTTLGVYDSLGALRTVTVTFQHPSSNNWAWTATTGSPASAIGSGTLTFDTNGVLTSGSSGTLTLPAGGGSSSTAITLDMSDLTQLATSSSVAASSQDGLAAGSLTGINVISSTGQVVGLYSNGLQQVIGQLALATFVNSSGLSRLGQNLYAQGLNSGEARVGTAGAGGRGTLVSGYLEASNVDLAQEFTNMIMAQRGFQASSRVITASDEMLQELVNLKR